MPVAKRVAVVYKAAVKSCRQRYGGVLRLEYYLVFAGCALARCESNGVYSPVFGRENLNYFTGFGVGPVFNGRAAHDAARRVLHKQVVFAGLRRGINARIFRAAYIIPCRVIRSRG